jgi:hypothetical protein
MMEIGGWSDERLAYRLEIDVFLLVIDPILPSIGKDNGRGDS